MNEPRYIVAWKKYTGDEVFDTEDFSQDNLPKFSSFISAENLVKWLIPRILDPEIVIFWISESEDFL